MSQLDRIESALAVLLERTKPHEDSLEACERSFHTPEPPPLGESPPSLAGAANLAASPEVRDGDAPQGHTFIVDPQSWSDLREIVRADHSLFAADQPETYCRISDGDALPVAVRLRGGGFVCEGCAVTAYDAEIANR